MAKTCVAIALLCALAAPATSIEKETPKGISLIQLIANPERYQGTRVIVIGYADIVFEGEALYLHEEDYRQALITNSVRLDVPSMSKMKEWQALRHTYVLVEGRFNSERRGRPGAAAGTLEDITRFEKWPSRAEHAARSGQPKQR